MAKKKVFVAMSPKKSLRDSTGRAGGVYLSPKKKVFVAMSGGVDSSVAAALLKEQGYDVSGVHMKMWSPQDGGQQPATSYQQGSTNPAPLTNDQLDTVCRQQYQDRIDAMRVAAKLDIPFQTWDFTSQYREAVVDDMIREYAVGRTPNPDVMCNRKIKFGLFLQRALARDADFVATGHYARIAREQPATSNQQPAGGWKLAAAQDSAKDQSYFLWTLGQRELAHTLFPLGEYTKPEVRVLARAFGLPTAEKPDSQGICFIGEIHLSEFLKKFIPEHSGNVLTTSGRTIGQHQGAEFFTIGQRQGLGIGGRRAEPGEPRQRAGGIPYYVARKDLAANTLVVAEGPYDGELFKRELVATDVRWVSGRAPVGEFPLACQARIRYRQPVQSCTVQNDETDKSDKIVPDDSSSQAPPAGRAGIHRAKPRLPPACRQGRDGQGFSDLIVTFDTPQRAVTPGQSIVFYSGETLLGGGIINAAS